MSTDTRFIAFYSYKGGVGRSLALANLACLLAWEGRKVLILDLDLEAPGQHQTSLFRDSYGVGKPINGILHLFDAFQHHRVAHADEATPPLFAWDIQTYLRRSTVWEAGGLPPGQAPAGSVWLLPAGTGAIDADYQRQLSRWDWDQFFLNGGEALLDDLRWRLREAGFDDVLIDSRTGLSDVFYVATLVLADTVICLSALNHQNLEGTDLAVRTLSAVHNRERYGEKCIMLALSPIPYNYLSESQIRQRLVSIRDRYPDLATWVAELPFVPQLALEEIILAAETANPATSMEPYLQQMRRLLTAINEDQPETMLSLPDRPENPFQRARIEYWPPSEIASHFVDPGGNLMAHLNEFMPTVVRGSRGTGKTTLARWFSYETQRWLIEKSNRPLGPDSIERIGLWFRLDIDLLNAFLNSDPAREPVYTQLFGQFLDLLIVRKALAALDELGGIGSWGSEEQIIRGLTREIGAADPVATYSAFHDAIEERLAEIRRHVNNPQTEPVPYRVQGNVLMKLLVESLRRGGRFQDRHHFAVFIDEYENFLPFQQQIVNTRVKQVKESDRVTYKLLLRNQTWNRDTMADGQPLEVTNDYRAYSLDEDIGLSAFGHHVEKVIEKHLTGIPYFARRDYAEPQKLFPGMTPVEEAERLAEKYGNRPLRQFLEKHHGSTVAAQFGPWMDAEPSLLRQAVAVVLLNQGKRADLVLKAMQADSAQARNWYHNYHVGAVFWMVSLYRQRARRKLYTGMAHIVGVAGGNIRVALDLCHAILERWLADAARNLPIDPLTQSDAIRAASDTYLRKLREQGDPEMARFIERLGRLFEIIHRGPRQGEPEINHFVVSDDLDPDVNKLLQRCRAEGALRWLPGNKQKSSADAYRDAWQLHPRYAPFFNISWRRKKCLDLPSSDLRTLARVEDGPWRALMKRIEDRYSRIGDIRGVAGDDRDDRQGVLL